MYAIRSYYVQNLRQVNSEVSDELHLLLLDLHNKLDSRENQQVNSDIKNIRNLLNEYPVNSPNYGKVIVQILSIADEQYQKAIQENNDRITSYNVCYTKLLRVAQFKGKFLPMPLIKENFLGAIKS